MKTGVAAALLTGAVALAGFNAWQVFDRTPSAPPTPAPPARAVDRPGGWTPPPVRPLIDAPASRSLMARRLPAPPPPPPPPSPPPPDDAPAEEQHPGPRPILWVPDDPSAAAAPPAWATGGSPYSGYRAR